MKLTLVLRDKKNALKLSTKTIESFMERIKSDTKDRTVGRRREQIRYTEGIESYDRQFPSHLIYPSAEFEKDENDNLRMKTFNGVVALTVEGLETAAEVEAVKRAAQILHYTLAAFIGPSGKEVVILVRIEKLNDAYSTISGTYSPAGATYLTEEEADALCQEGHSLASAIYQGILPKAIRQDAISVRSCFHMPLDENPYFNPKAVALAVSAKPLVVRTETNETEHTESLVPSDEDAQEVSRKTRQLMGFLKNIITLSSVKIKRPYGRHVEDFPRRASFIATTNQADVLADPSGSRRFLSVELTGPIDVSTPPNYEQLYAQAMRALHQHESYYFGPTETQEIQEWNRRFSMKTAAEQFFLDYFEPATDEKDGQWISASAISSYLKEEVGVSLLKPISLPVFGRKLTNLPGLQKRVTKYNTEYLVKRKK